MYVYAYLFFNVEVSRQRAGKRDGGPNIIIVIIIVIILIIVSYY